MLGVTFLIWNERWGEVAVLLVVLEHRRTDSRQVSLAPDPPSGIPLVQLPRNADYGNSGEEDHSYSRNGFVHWSDSQPGRI